MSTCTEPLARRAASVSRRRTGADFPAVEAAVGAPEADPADDPDGPADGPADDPAWLVGPVWLASPLAAGDAAPLPLQPASAPSPSSAAIVSVIALAWVCRCVLMSDEISRPGSNGSGLDRTGTRSAGHGQMLRFRQERLNDKTDAVGRAVAQAHRLPEPRPPRPGGPRRG